MAARAHAQNHPNQPTPTTTVEPSKNQQQPPDKKLLTSYLGLTFAVYLGLTRNTSLSSLTALQSRNRDLYLNLIEAEEQLHQLRCRRKEDSKANARVVEIFASQRNSWRREEERLLRRVEAGEEEIGRLRERTAELEKSDGELRREVEELRREVGEREEMLNFLTRRPEFEDGGGEGGDGCGDFRVFEGVREQVGAEEGFLETEGYNDVEEIGGVFGSNNGFNPELRNSASKFWADRGSIWQV